MLKPPPLPASYVDLPVTPHEAQQARAGVEVNGNRIQTGFTALIVLNILSAALVLLGAWWLQRSLPNLLQNWGIPMTPADQRELRDVMNEIPAWFWMVSAGLTLVATAINVWCFNVIRKVIAAVQHWTLEPTSDRADELIQKARTVRPWITLGQWFPLITGILVTLLYVALTFGTGTNMAENVISMGISLFSSLVTMLPGIIVAWLGLAAVKRWLDAVVTRTYTPTFPVRPFARSLDGWLIFTFILIILAVLNLLVGTVSLAFFPAVFGWLLSSTSTTTPPDDGIMRFVGKIMQSLAWYALLGLLSYTFWAFLVYWSRNFANSVAQLLDANRPTQPQPAQQDWTPSVPQDW